MWNDVVRSSLTDEPAVGKYRHSLQAEESVVELRLSNHENLSALLSK